MAQGQGRRSSSSRESRPRSEYWRGQHEAWLRSGLTQADFCDEHEVSLAAFRWWRWKLKREAPGNRAAVSPLVQSQGMRMVPVRVVDPQAPSLKPQSGSASLNGPSTFDVLLESGTCVRVPRDFDAESLSRLLRTLEAARC